MASPAVAVIARWEWSRRWRALLALAVVGGLLGGLVVAGAVVARRTVSAPSRLFTSVAPGDVHLRVFDADVAARARRLPDVEASWVGGVAIGRVEGGPSLQYAGIVAPTVPESPLVRPVVLEGRLADPTDPAEVMVTEALAGQAGLRVDDHLELAMLSPAEVFEFDTGFGEPDGPTLPLTIVGVLRVPPRVFEGTPLLATPAFAAVHRDLFAGYDLHVRLRGGSTTASAYTDVVRRLADSTGGAGADDFAAVAADRPRDGTDALIEASQVLIAGLIAAVAVGGTAVVAALAQAWSRHHGSAAATQRVEVALGMTSGQRVLARLLPAAAAALVAGVLAAVVGVTASWKQPIGSLWRVEPAGGWRADWVAVVFGGLAVAVTMSVLAATTAWRAGRRGVDATAAARGRRLRLAPSRHGWPLAGAAFALAGGGARRHVSMRISLAACVVGVAGVVGSITFDASLDRLVDTPRRWGWDADLVIADVDDAIVDETLADARLEAVSESYNAEVVIDGRPTDAFAVRERRGDTGWVLQQGRLPASPTEVVLGGKLAAQLDVGVGDRVSSPDGSSFVVVGLGLGPTWDLERLGGSALFTFDGLSQAASTTSFREALIRVAPGEDVRAVVADYSRYELTVRTLPSPVRDISELGSLPMLLGAFLGLLAAIALVHALVVTVSGRARDLAVLRALGSTPREAGLAVVVMAVTTAVVGLVAGVPLGYGVARLLWGEVARSIGVEADVALSTRLLLVPVGVVIGAITLAAIPARRAARRRPGEALRAG